MRGKFEIIRKKGEYRISGDAGKTGMGLPPTFVWFLSA